MPATDRPSAGPPSRRDFLRTASASAAFAAGGPAFLSRRSPNEVLGLGVIGVGGMGGAHCRSFVNIDKSGSEKVQLRAISDVCKPRLDRALDQATQGGAPKVSGHRYYQELLDRKDIDCVLIATPEHWHAQMAIDAMAAGKDVYLEKPMTLDLDDAIRLYRFSQKSDRILQVGTQFVTDPKYDKARDLIADGAIGKAVTSQTGYCRNSKIGEWNYYGIDPKVQPGKMLDWDAWCGPLGKQDWNTLIYHRWRRYRKYSSGIIGDLLVHQMTPLVNCLNVGWPTRVTGSGGHYIDKAMENFDQVNLTIEFEKGHTMVVWGSTCNATGPAPMIRGHKANLSLSGNRCSLTAENLFSDEIDSEDFKMKRGASQDRLRVNWLHSVRSRKQPLSPPELAMKIMVIVDLAVRSMWEQKSYRFDPKTFTASSC